MLLVLFNYWGPKTQYLIQDKMISLKTRNLFLTGKRIINCFMSIQSTMEC